MRRPFGNTCRMSGSSGIPTAPRSLPHVSGVFSALLSHVCLLCLSVCVQSSGMGWSCCTPALHHAIKSQTLPIQMGNLSYQVSVFYSLQTAVNLVNQCQDHQLNVDTLAYVILWLKINQFIQLIWRQGSLYHLLIAGFFCMC